MGPGPDLGWSWEEVGRLVLAVGLGIFIGFERELLHKPAGVRTIGIVTLGSCLIMMLGIRMNLAYGSDTDPVRLAAQVISGIGFLCAGVIIQTRMHVEGLTTAAVVWMMAAVGLAIGAGWYVIGIATTGLAWMGLTLEPVVQKLVSMRRKALPGYGDEDSDGRIYPPEAKD